MQEVLDSRVLVLNRLYQPVQLTTVRRAVVLLFSGRARAVASDYSLHDWEHWVARPALEERAVRSPRLSLEPPRVVLMLYSDHQPLRRIPFSRRNVLRRDGFQCQYCGATPGPEALNVDHVVPLGQRGTTVWSNVVASCATCNTRKGCRTPEQAGMRLLRRPQVPGGGPLTRRSLGQAFEPDWAPFLA